MKKIILLWFSTFLILSGCGQKQEQPTTSQAVEESPAPQDSAGDSSKVSEKTEPKAEAPKDEQAKTVSKENSQSEASTLDTTHAKETIKKDSNPTEVSTKQVPPQPATVKVQPTAAAPEVKPASPTLPPPEVKKSETVQLSIRGDKEQGVILAPAQVKFETGDTVLKLLARSLKEKNIPMEYRGAAGAAYVEGIANLYEFDRGPTSGWMFRVNGVFSSQSAGAVKLQPGDQVEWLYTLDLGKDIGAKP